MLDNLFNLFEKKTALTVINEIISLVERLLCFFEADYLKEGQNSKNAAIDALVSLLESFKTPEAKQKASIDTK